jgi:hypothetical protein
MQKYSFFPTLYLFSLEFYISKTILAAISPNVKTPPHRGGFLLARKSILPAGLARRLRYASCRAVHYFFARVQN